MCTALTYHTKDYYFGRNLDIEYSFNEKVIITPRNFPFEFRCVKNISRHYAIIGIGIIENEYPLYYDATNEKGLSMAGLNFPDNAFYKAQVESFDNITPFEFIPWILGQCATVTEAEKLLTRINLVDINFSENLPLSPLHWIIADREKSIVVEPCRDGLRIHQNPVGVLTNNPVFEYHMINLNNYINLTAEAPVNRFSDKVELKSYSRGMGALGLPGDLSSASRFIRCTFCKLNSVSGNSEAESVSQFFHILGSVEQQRGCVHINDDKFEMTLYSSCCNVDRGLYYYRTYDNSQISCVDINKENLDGKNLIAYPLIEGQRIKYQN